VNVHFGISIAREDDKYSRAEKLTSAEPACAAKCSGRQPCSVHASTSAPLSSSKATSPVVVRSSMHYIVSGATCFEHCLTYGTPALPCMQACASGVHLSLSVALASAPSAIRCCACSGRTAFVAQPPKKGVLVGSCHSRSLPQQEQVLRAPSFTLLQQ
jgi:hypothetical protein